MRNEYNEYSDTYKVQMRLDEIIAELNRLARESGDLGPTSLEMAIDFRADAWDVAYDEYPEPTPEEVERMRRDADAAAERANAIDERIDELIGEYYELTGATPHYYEMSGTYARSWHEKF